MNEDGEVVQRSKPGAPTLRISKGGWEGALHKVGRQPGEGDVLRSWEKQVLKGGGNNQLCEWSRTGVCGRERRERNIWGYALLFQLIVFFHLKSSVSPACSDVRWWAGLSATADLFLVCVILFLLCHSYWWCLWGTFPWACVHLLCLACRQVNTNAALTIYSTVALWPKAELEICLQLPSG